MVSLGEITPENWLEAAHLQLTGEQSAFVAGPVGILARGYVYRDCRARVWTVEEDGRVVGLALVRVYTKAGFADSGYIDPDVPDALNLVCRL